MKKSEITRSGRGDSSREKHPWPYLAEFPGVRAVCLFGSTARGEDARDSDVDILVLVDDGLDRESLRAEARAIRSAVDQSTQICLLSEEKLRASFSERTVFATHLAREGRVMADRDGALTRLLEDYPRDLPVRESAHHLAIQLDVYSDLAWCGGHYLFCLADLYAWSRSGAMLALAQRGQFQFARHKVFHSLGDMYPDLRPAATVAERLRPFWEKVNRPEARPLPFPPDGSDDQVMLARDACRAIVQRGLLVA